MQQRNFQQEYPFHNILNGIQEKNSFNTSYFSQTNIDTIQNSIINEVYLRKGFAIQKQNQVSVVTVMKGIYLQDGGRFPGNPSDYTQEFKRLNKKVVDYSVEKIIPIISQQIDYIKDITDPLKVIDRPINVSMYGTKTTKFKF